MASLEEKLSRLPPDLRELVQSLPPEQSAQILDKLIQTARLSFRALNERDVESIKAGAIKLKSKMRALIMPSYPGSLFV
jgi:hypothetical protein